MGWDPLCSSGWLPNVVDWLRTEETAVSIILKVARGFYKVLRGREEAVPLEFGLRTGTILLPPCSVILCKLQGQS